MEMNSTIRAIIADDESRGRDTLAELIRKHCPALEVQAQTDSADSTLSAIRRLQPDVVFLDILMPGGSGFKVVETVAERSFDVIFVTAYEHYALRAIKAAAVDYLLKPILVEDLLAAIDRLTGNRKRDGAALPSLPSSGEALALRTSRRLSLPTAQGYRFIDISDLMRCLGRSNYTEFHLLGGTRILVSRTLAEFERSLVGHNFMRVHKAHLVNLHYVREYHKGRGGIIIMADGAEVEISTRRRDLFLQRIHTM